MLKFTKTAHYISNKIGKAIGDYNLIEKGDRILVAVSGGKDSLTLLKMLKERQRWSPVRYELLACHIETDFRCSSCIHKETLSKIFAGFGIKGIFRKVSVLDRNKETNCFWCSWNRRKTLFETAGTYECNKVAFGHHKDDIVETILLNIFFHGELSSMNPRQEIFNGELVIIRPLCYVEEEAIEIFAREHGFSSKLCRCPFYRNSKRRYVKEFIRDTEKIFPGIKTNIFNSISRIKWDYLKLGLVNK